MTYSIRPKPRGGLDRMQARPILFRSFLSTCLLGIILLSFSPDALGQIGQLVINPIPNTNVTAGSRLTFLVSVTNPEPANLVWSLGNAPAGATITTNTVNPNPAIFTWTPADNQTGIVSIVVNVFQFENPANQTNTSFIVTVNGGGTPGSSPPDIADIPDQTVAAGTLLSFSVFATNTDNSSTPILFSLDIDAPAGVTISNVTDSSAVVNWTPTIDQAPNNYTFGIIATEQSNPPIDNSTTVNVSVVLTNNCESYNDFLAAVAQGGTVELTNCPTIVLSNTITIANDVFIDGGTNNVMITGNNLVRLFTVMPSVNFAINGVVLSGGQSTNGGALYINAGAQVTLSNCTFAGNSAKGTNGVSGTNGVDNPGTGGSGLNGTAGAPAFGGAIYNEGALTISLSSFLTNSAVGGSGGNGGNGGSGSYQGGNGGNGGNGGRATAGAIHHVGTFLSIDSCTFDGNTVTAGQAGSGGTNGSGPFDGLPGIGGAGASAFGGALYATNDVTIINSTFSDNTAAAGNSAAGGTLSNGNGSNGSAGGSSTGGGICNIDGQLLMTNCTVSGNQATGGNGGNGGPGRFSAGNGGAGGSSIGGGLYSTNRANTSYLVNCTFGQNGAFGGTNGVAGTAPFNGTDGAPGTSRGGNFATAGVSNAFVLINSLVSTNLTGFGSGYFGPGFRGLHNLSWDKSIHGSDTNILVQTADVRLGPLSDNGGPTKTMALLTTNTPGITTNSLAIDAIPLTEDFPETDQRGVARPVGAGADIGAFELGYFISGQVTNADGGLPGVEVFIGTNSVVTDPDGMFTSATLPGIYQVTPSSADFKFSPVSRTVPVNGNISNVNFSASSQFVISGRIIEGSTGLPGVSVAVGTNTVTTDTNGNYTVTGLGAGSYVVTPVLGCHFFNPSNRSVTVSLSSATGIDFIAGRLAYSVSGQVTSGNVGLAQVSVAIGTNTVKTDADGNYSFSALCPGNYTAQPSLSGYAFDPPAISVAVGPDTNGVNFSAFSAFSLSGQVKEGTNGLSGVTIMAGTNTVTTSSNGVYSFPALRAATYSITPSLACYHFNPSSVSIALGASTNDVNFAGTHDAYAISGQLVSGGSPLGGVTITAGGKSTTTAANGIYVLSNLCAGSYTVVPALTTYEFQPPTMSVLLPPNTNGVNFSAVSLFSIGGQITQGTNGPGLTGVRVAIGTNTVLTTNGAYALSNLRAGSYNVTPSQDCFRFTPPNLIITVGPSTNAVNFAGTQTLFMITGRVSDPTKGLSGVAVRLSQSVNLITTVGTDVNGNYAFSGLCPGSYQVQASLPGYDFGPPKSVTVVNGDQTGLNFSALYSISGTVARTNGIGLSGVTIAVANGGVSTNGTTDVNGSFSVPGLAPATYTLTPNLTGFTFTPPSRTVTVTNQGVANVNFTGGGPPSIVTQPTNQQVPSCVSATFTVVAANDPPFTYQWQLRGTAITTATNSSYTTPNGESTNLGVYTVVVGNAFGSARSSPATLSLYLPPYICLQPNNQAVALGSNATFTVQASGASPLFFQWQFNGTNIVGATNSSFTIQNASVADSGSYRVSVANSSGSTNSLPATLSVNLAPANLTGPFSQTVGAGCSVSFSVLADGSSPFSYQWRHEGTNISGATDVAYTIDTVQTTDAGSYDVIVGNSYGVTNSAPAVLTVDPSGATISGHVRDGAISLSGVTVTAGTNSAVTDANGDYVILGLQPGTYSVMATQSGYRFNGPLQATVPPCVSAANFTAQYTISGHVFAGTNGISGVRIFGGRTTDAQGAYSLSLPADTYTLLPFKATYLFTPGSRTVVIPPDASNQDFYSTWLITNITHSANGTVHFAVAGNGSLRIEISTNLVNWVSISTNSAPFTFTDSTAASAPIRFYRVVLQH